MGRDGEGEEWGAVVGPGWRGGEGHVMGEHVRRGALGTGDQGHEIFGLRMLKAQAAGYTLRVGNSGMVLLWDFSFVPGDMYDKSMARHAAM